MERFVGNTHTRVVEHCSLYILLDFNIKRRFRLLIMFNELLLRDVPALDAYQ